VRERERARERERQTYRERERERPLGHLFCNASTVGSDYNACIDVHTHTHAHAHAKARTHGQTHIWDVGSKPVRV
jgi:hypothetical protein